MLTDSKGEGMASILTFPQRDRPIGAASHPTAPAKIIIFPGVRYERATGGDPAVAWPAARPLSPLQPLPSK